VTVVTCVGVGGIGATPDSSASVGRTGRYENHAGGALRFASERLGQCDCAYFGHWTSGDTQALDTTANDTYGCRPRSSVATAGRLGWRLKDLGTQSTLIMEPLLPWRSDGGTRTRRRLAGGDQVVFFFTSDWKRTVKTHRRSNVSSSEVL